MAQSATVVLDANLWEFFADPRAINHIMFRSVLVNPNTDGDPIVKIELLAPFSWSDSAGLSIVRYRDVGSSGASA